MYTIRDDACLDGSSDAEEGVWHEGPYQPTSDIEQDDQDED